MDMSPERPASPAKPPLRSSHPAFIAGEVDTGFIERQRTIFGGNIIEDLHASQGGMVDAASTLAASASCRAKARRCASRGE